MKFEDFNEIFKHVDSYIWWPCDVDNRKIFDISKNNFENLSKNATKNKFMVRTAGQSGSGKTTQLLPVCNALYDKLRLNPVHLCVREFALLHPKYNEINVKNASQMREITNGFALRCLIVSMVMAMENGFDILFEVTLLAQEFEKFVLDYAKRFGYKNLFLCLAVSKELSDNFIEKRKRGTSFENGRIISDKSSSFFYDTMIDAIKFIAKTSPNDQIIVWDAYKKRPIYNGIIKKALPLVEEGRAKKCYLRYSEDALRSAKINYLLKHFTLN